MFKNKEIFSIRKLKDGRSDSVKVGVAILALATTVAISTETVSANETNPSPNVEQLTATENVEQDKPINTVENTDNTTVVTDNTTASNEEPVVKEATLAYSEDPYAEEKELINSLDISEELKAELIMLVEAGEELTEEMILEMIGQAEPEEEQPVEEVKPQENTVGPAVIEEDYIHVNKQNKYTVDKSEYIDELKSLTEDASIYFEIKPDSDMTGRSAFFSVSGTEDDSFFQIFSNEGVVKAELYIKGEHYKLASADTPLELNKWNNIAFVHNKLTDATGENKIYVNGKLSYSAISQTGARFVDDFKSSKVAFGAMPYKGSYSHGGRTLEIKNFKVFNKAISDADVVELSKFTQPTDKEETKEFVAESSIFGQQAQTGYYGFRAPSTIALADGTLLTFASEHVKHHIDWGDLNTAVWRSEDKGQTWSKYSTIIDLAENPTVKSGIQTSGFTIDNTVVQDKETGKIFLMSDVFRQGQGLFNTGDNRPQYTDGKLNLYMDDKTTEAYTVDKDGRIFDPQGNATEYTTVLPENAKDPKKSDIGNIYNANNELVGNYFFTTGQKVPLRITSRGYTYLSTSEDNGKTWSNPKDITKDLLQFGVSEVLVSPNKGFQSSTGRLIVPVYLTDSTYRNGRFKASIMYSDDKGETWNVDVNSKVKFASPNPYENSVVDLGEGNLLMAARNHGSKTVFYTSTDDGKTWSTTPQTFDEIPSFRVQPSLVTTEQDGKKYVLLSSVVGPMRTNGAIFALEIDENNKLTFVKSKVFEKNNSGYSSLVKLDNDNFLVTYEHAPVSYSQFGIYQKRFNFDWIFEEDKIEKNEIVNVKHLENNTFEIEYKYPVTTVQNPNVTVDNVTSKFVKQSDTNKLVFTFDNPNNLLSSIITSLSGIESVDGYPFELNAKVKLAEFSKGDSVDRPELKELDFKPETKKGDSLKLDPLPEIKIEFAKGDSIILDKLPEIIIETKKGDSLKQDELPTIPLETKKGEPLTLEEKPEITIETKKGDSLVLEEKPEIVIETKKGDSLTSEEKPELTIETKKGNPITLEEKPKLELEKLNETSQVKEEKLEVSIETKKDIKQETENPTKEENFNSSESLLPETGANSNSMIFLIISAIVLGAISIFTIFKNKKDK